MAARTSLESIGQRSINNVVDATNYVMFDIGQPLHAFDAGKLSDRDGTYATLPSRKAKDGERMVALDGKEYDTRRLDACHRRRSHRMPIGIAGIKGGAPAAIDRRRPRTSFSKSANFDGVSVRKTSQALKLRTDASSDSNRCISPELAAYGMRAVAELIVRARRRGDRRIRRRVSERQPAEARAFPSRSRRSIAYSARRCTRADVDDAFDRLAIRRMRKNGETYTVFVPFERLDLPIPEDLVEEVARIIGYDKVPAVELPRVPEKARGQCEFLCCRESARRIDRQGYSEVFTCVFADKGDRVVANKVDGVRPYLRATLVDGLRDAYERNIRNKDLLGLKQVRLFEIGTSGKRGMK